MNIDKLIEAAKEIERLKQASDKKTKDWQDLAKDVKNESISKKDADIIKQKLTSTVVDFSTAIDMLVYWLNKD